MESTRHACIHSFLPLLFLSPSAIMYFSLITACLASIGLVSAGVSARGNTGSISVRTINSTCVQIQRAISKSSTVEYDILGLNGNYNQAMSHWMSSSSQNAMCAVIPGTEQDVAIALKIIGATRTPFAIKGRFSFRVLVKYPFLTLAGGGHASNPGFSSTKGVMISMSKFNKVTYSSTKHTAMVGAGLIWDDVYAALEPHNVSVVGGRVHGVGVAGFTLAGGA